MLSMDYTSGNPIKNILYSKEYSGYSDNPELGLHFDFLSNLIMDGEEIYNRYQGASTSVGSFSRVRGSFHNRLRSSIYNHRLEKSMGIDEKLRILKLEGDEVRTPPEAFNSTSELFRNTWMASKCEVILAGKELGHCIGGLAGSSDWVLRKGDVCAHVSSVNGKVLQCLDKGNTISEESKSFRAEIEFEVEKLVSKGLFEAPPPPKGGLTTYPLRYKHRRIFFRDNTQDVHACRYY